MLFFFYVGLQGFVLVGLRGEVGARRSGETPLSLRGGTPLSLRGGVAVSSAVSKQSTHTLFHQLRMASSAPSPVSMAEVRALAARGRAAMVVGPNAYDFTDFLSQHPGGPQYLTKNVGKVATDEFIASHPLDIIARTLSKSQLAAMRLGPIDASTIQPSDMATSSSSSSASTVASHSAPAIDPFAKPSLESCLNVYDFEAIATRLTLTESALAYYSSGGDDEITLRENHSAYHRLWMKPRVMVNVKNISMETRILGHRSSFPVFLSAVAMCKMGCPEEGELAWMRGAAREGVIYMIPTLSGFSFDEIIAARGPSALPEGPPGEGQGQQQQPMWYQLYVNPDWEKNVENIQKAEKAGCTGLFITCDAPQLGNREKDRRVKVSHSGAAVQGGKVATQAEGTSKALTGFIDPSLDWAMLERFKGCTGMKIVLKGVGTAEDTVRAFQAGCAGVLLSNHGGRQLDFARSALEVLPEAMAALRALPGYTPEAFEVYVDGGVRRGTDIFKALALGAKAVGVGRPALYAMSAFGTEGVAKMLRILKGELEMTMRLMGTPTLGDIKPEMIDTRNLNSHTVPVPADFLQQGTYIPAVTQAQRNRAAAEAAAIATAATATAASNSTAAAITHSTGGAQGGGGEVEKEGSTAASILQLVQGVARGLLGGIFTTESRPLVSRTSLVLLLYCVAHAGGNGLLLVSKDAFNGYAFLLRGHPILSVVVKAVEVYLLVATLGHLASGAYLTVKDGKLASLHGARLALSGGAIATFAYFHLLHFRFNPEVMVSPFADMHAVVLKVMKSPLTAGLYGAACLAVGAHALWGWDKTSKKLKDPTTDKPALGEGARAMGTALIVATTALFCAVTGVAYALANGLL